MRVEARKYLFDVQHAAEMIERFLGSSNYDDYLEDPLLRSGVERQFEIIGEALRQLATLDQTSASKISSYRRIIAFRNILIHGYADIDHRVVWGIAQTRLPGLKAEVAALLEEDEK